MLDLVVLGFEALIRSVDGLELLSSVIQKSLFISEFVIQRVNLLILQLRHGLGSRLLLVGELLLLSHVLDQLLDLMHLGSILLVLGPDVVSLPDGRLALVVCLHQLGLGLTQLLGQVIKKFFLQGAVSL